MKSSLEVTDSELINLLAEDEENIKNIIYEEYGYLIDVIIRKYNSFIKMFQIDEQELRCEASYGFSDGINSYHDNKNTTLKTFLSLCIERRVIKFLTKFTTQKSQMLKDALSLDESHGEGHTPLIEILSDEGEQDPLNNLTYIETFEEIVSLAKASLSEFEYIVFTYMLNETTYQQIARILDKTPKQIDNTIQRIKLKMRKILEDNKIN
ncbi:MAG: hypothetical protein E7164_03880 [Firmicutes bacterium]|nr:hypothetical protein [Bacillota bacterium]